VTPQQAVIWLLIGLVLVSIVGLDLLLALRP
jgi:hypothetical protein